MRKLLFCFVLLAVGLAACFVVQPLAAQTTPDFKVQISTDNEPVGFAYVFVGDEYHAMADENGVLTIPAAKLTPGVTIVARFVGMESVPFVWDGKMPAGSVITLNLIPQTLDEVVVTTKSRDRSRKLYRKYVKKIPTHGWLSGFTGDYEMNFTGDRPWNSRGTYVRNHVPGEDANLRKVDTFSLVPERAADSLIAWQIQRNVLLVSSIAERAVQLEGYESTNDMVMRYRGLDGGRHVFLIIKPWFDQYTGADDSFQTKIWVNEASGLVTSSQTVSRTRYGTWNVSADYAVHSGGGVDRSERFIYPVRITGKYEEKNPTLEDAIAGEIEISNVAARHFLPEPIPQTERQ
jgi:hypothetical protein